MSLQPSSSTKIDRATHTPFLLRLYWRANRSLEAHEFSIAPPPPPSQPVNFSTSDSDAPPSPPQHTDYASLLPSSLRHQSVQIYTWPTCTLAELTGLLTSVLPSGVLPQPTAVGTRLVYRLVFPDTRGGVSDGGRGKWIDRPLGSVVIGGRNAGEASSETDAGDWDLEGEAEKTLADARFVIGDYVVCSIYPPGADGRVAPLPSTGFGGGRGGREDRFASARGLPPPPRENGFGPPRGMRGRGGGGFGGGAPPMGDWRRGERPPGYGGGSGGGYRGRGGRPY